MFRCSKNGYCMYCQCWCNQYNCKIEDVEDKEGKDFVYENCGPAYYSDNCIECEYFEFKYSKECKHCKQGYDDEDIDWNTVWKREGI